uniref:Uncharacterized protein n=1 Tax=Diacronema lutheri TaxID=2081491 RepID=A0A7R9ULA8_DIALT|mmetsp:Transcript_15426/g.48055  ORF Transcript_15426/g.48055 Transcript_15426/m.48055 type:complete len:279 (+) Transcript_15426:41-877(+)
MEVELRQIREGLHPTLKAELRKLEEARQRQKAEAQALRESRERLADEDFERERKAAEADFKAEEESLRERFLLEFEERRRRTDEGRFDGQFSQMRAAAIRKMRTRSNVDAAGGAAAANPAARAKREKLPWAAVQFALKQSEVHDDFEELQRSQALSLRHAEDAAAAEEAQAAKKPRVAPEQTKAAAARKAGARGKQQPELNMKGKAPSEASGSRITVWYEETTTRGKQDVPYVGTVTGLKKDGLAVRFDGSPDDEELITNDDEWLWGEHKKKPSHGVR